MCPMFKLMSHLVYFSECASEINPLNAELNRICHLLALFRAHHILHVSRIRANFIAFRHQREKATSVSLNVLFNDALHC